MKNCFHLAIPSHDLEATKKFYTEILGCTIGRESQSAMVIKFFDHQLVPHKVEKIPEPQKTIYPRHFGLVIYEKDQFDSFVARLKRKRAKFFIELKTRSPGSPTEHQTFFLKDPSNNLLEFKYYTNESAIFDEKQIHEVGE